MSWLLKHSANNTSFGLQATHFTSSSFLPQPPAGQYCCSNSWNSSTEWYVVYRTSKLQQILTSCQLICNMLLCKGLNVDSVKKKLLEIISVWSKILKVYLLHPYKDALPVLVQKTLEQWRLTTEPWRFPLEPKAMETPSGAMLLTLEPWRPILEP